MTFLRPALRLAAHQARTLPTRTLPVSLRALSTSSAPAYEHILHSTTGAANQVSLITLNRPKALNALSGPLVEEIVDALERSDADPAIGAIVLTGSDKAFAAGADIKQMAGQTFEQSYGTDFLNTWTKVSKVRKPTIAAVSGYALGGGCELAMSCDIILASPSAVFGQPEINLGVIPGAGGTQRLTHAIGKSRAMEIVLSGKNFTAQEAASWGLVSRVVGEGEGEVLKEAVKLADKISSKGRLAVLAAKEAVNAADELALNEGLRLERRLFHALFSTADQKEGMSAFIEKRKPKWVHES